MPMQSRDDKIPLSKADSEMFGFRIRVTLWCRMIHGFFRDRSHLIGSSGRRIRSSIRNRPLLSVTFVVAGIASLHGIPIGLTSALYSANIRAAHAKFRQAHTRILAGVPRWFMVISH